MNRVLATFLFAAFFICEWYIATAQEKDHTNAPVLTIENLSPAMVMVGDTVTLKCLLQGDGSFTENDITWFSSVSGKTGTGKWLHYVASVPGKHVFSAVVRSSNTKVPAIQQIIVDPYRPSEKMTSLVDWLTGDFSSAAQADTSGDKYHVDVRLRMRQIWPDRNDGVWIYVEQAYADDTAKPDRQRIYRLYEPNGTMRDDIYKIPNDSLYVSGWNDTSLFGGLLVDSLVLKDHCGMTFTWLDEEEAFFAVTNGHNCRAGIPGVEYITSESKVYRTRFTSWDRGYDESGNVVMGPYSPYVFNKISNFEIAK